MNLKRLNGVIALSLAGGLLLAGCGDDEEDPGVKDTGGNPDSGVVFDMGEPDTGTPADAGEDTGVEDTGVEDTGVEDTGAEDMGTDSGILDLGTPDAGASAPTPGEEGADCDETNPMSPCGTGLRCLSFSDADTDPSEVVAKCLRECTTDADCAASTINPPAAICDPNFGICVQELGTEDEVIQVYREDVNSRMKGCAPGLDPFVGAQIGLNDGEFNCVRLCETNDDCPTTGINYCNVQRGVFTSTAITGICSRGPGYPGAACSNRLAIEGCSLDWDGLGQTLCSDFFGLLDEDGFGTCVSYCGDLDEDSTTPPDACAPSPDRPNGPTRTCITTTNGTPPQDLFSVPGIGVCSDACSAFPNSCAGNTSCTPYSQQFIVDVEWCEGQRDPTLPMWSGLTQNPIQPPTAAENCAGRGDQCPLDSFCLDLDGDPSTAESGCVFGCDATEGAATTGCEGKTVGGSSNLLCNPLQTGSTEGICFPL